MGITELFFTAIGLAMDAFAVSICIGLSCPRAGFKQCAAPGLYFGIFQGAMPLIGYFAGSAFGARVMAFDHWVAFVLLGFIGIRMIVGSFKPEGEIAENHSVGPRRMLPLAVATSIDALAVGVTFAFLQVDIAPAVAFIGVITLVLSAAGVKIGNLFGLRFKSGAEMFGGAILVLIGTKTLLEHTGIISF